MPQAPWLDYFTVSHPKQVADFAELGVVFLLFMIGLELSWERLRLMRRLVFGLGAAQTVGAAVLIAAVGVMFGLAPLGALAIGAALAMSSTAVVVPVMAEAGRLHEPSGRAVFSILLFQDLAVAPILIALALLGGRAHNPWLALGTAVAGLAGIVVVGRLLLRPLFRSAARAKSAELFMALSLLIVIGAGLCAELLGLSMALGAFVAGILLAETEYRHEVEVLIGPFKDLLLGLFFLSIGLGLDVALIVSQPGLVLGVAAGLIALKAAVGAGLCRAFGIKGGEALESGLVLAAGGEFAFVVLEQASGAGLVPAAVAEAMVVSAGLSMVAIPALGLVGARLGRAQEKADAADGHAPPPKIAEEEPRVLIVGYGRVGRMVAEMLDRPRHRLDRGGPQRARGGRRPARGRPCVLRRRLAAGASGAVRPQRGARRGADHRRAGGGRGGGGRPPAACAPTWWWSPAPATRATPGGSTSSASPTRCPRPSRPACSFPRPCWSISACRWAS